MGLHDRDELRRNRELSGVLPVDGTYPKKATKLKNTL